MHFVIFSDFRSVTNDDEKDVIQFRGKCNDTNRFSFNANNSTTLLSEHLKLINFIVFFFFKIVPERNLAQNTIYVITNNLSSVVLKCT